MQKVSLAVSLVALGLMIVGFVSTLLDQGSASLSEDSGVSFSKLIRFRAVPPNLLAMSAGIVLLALLPCVRVVLAVWIYIRRKEIVNLLVALVVLLELLMSMRTGG
jgi:uncharacterized membrane protein